MRVLAVASMLLLSSSLVPSFAQNEAKSPALSQPQSTPVQPELTPQQSDQAKEQTRQRPDDTRVNRDWRAQQRDSETGGSGQNDLVRMRDMDRDIDRDHRTVGRGWQMDRNDQRDRAEREGYGRDYYHDEDRPQRRVKICVEYENGDEYCHYRQ